MRTVLIVAAFLLGTLGVTGAVVVGWAWMMVAPWVQTSGPRPSDAAMIAHFRAHRAAFERLAAMLSEDKGLKRIGRDFTEPQDIALPPARLAQYRALFAELGVISASHYGRQIDLIYYTAGIYIAGSAKSFCYGPPPDFAEEVDGDLDARRDKAARDRERDFTFQRRIEGDWWLQYEGT